VNKYHQELLKLFELYAGTSLSKHSDDYVGSSKSSYHINSPMTEKIVKSWIKMYPNMTISEYIDLLNNLSLGKSHTEFSAIGMLLRLKPKLRRELNPTTVSNWLNCTEGWAEVDAICQGNFTANEMLNDWDSWKKVLDTLAIAKNIHKRRASLVLLTGPVRHSQDSRLSDMAFKNIEILKSGKEILVTKAISWLLRDLVKLHKEKVENYLNTNETTLPRIAMRETRNKLKSGRKSGK